MTLEEAARKLSEEWFIKINKDVVSIGITDNSIIIYTAYRTKRLRNKIKIYEGYPVEVIRSGRFRPL